MDQNYFGRILTMWEKYYYTEPIMYSCMIALMLYGFLHNRKEKTFKIFLLYVAIGFLVMLFTRLVMADIIVVSEKLLINESANVIFLFFETLAFIYYYIKVFKSKKIQMVLGILMALISICVIIYFAIASNPKYNISEVISLSFQINAIEFIFLLFPCLYYFYSTIKLSTVFIPLKIYPSFWVSVGLFFYIIISLPFLLVGNTLISYNYGLYTAMFSIHYMSISFLFICLVKAFKCKAILTT